MRDKEDDKDDDVSGGTSSQALVTTRSSDGSSSETVATETAQYKVELGTEVFLDPFFDESTLSSISLRDGGSLGVSGSTYFEEVVTLLSPPSSQTSSSQSQAPVLVKTRLFFAHNGMAYVMHSRNDTGKEVMDAEYLCGPARLASWLAHTSTPHRLSLTPTQYIDDVPATPGVDVYDVFRVPPAASRSLLANGAAGGEGKATNSAAPRMLALAVSSDGILAREVTLTSTQIQKPVCHRKRRRCIQKEEVTGMVFEGEAVEHTTVVGVCSDGSENLEYRTCDASSLAGKGYAVWLDGTTNPRIPGLKCTTNSDCKGDW